VVGINGAVKEDFRAVVGFQLREIHAAAARLKRVQSIQSGNDHGGIERLVAAATVTLNLQPVLVAEINQPFQVRHDEPVELCRAEQRSGLTAEIVVDEEHIHHIRRRVERALANSDVGVREMLQQHVHQFRIVVHLKVEVFHAEQVDRIVPEKRPIAAEDGVLTVPRHRVGAHLSDVLPLRVRPRVIVDFLEGGATT